MSKNDAKLIELQDSRNEMVEIANITRDVLDTERNIDITRADAIPTIVYEYMVTLFKYIGDHKSTEENFELKFADLFRAGVSYRESEDGEKDANFTPYLIPGSTFKILVKSDDTTEEE